MAVANKRSLEAVLNKIEKDISSDGDADEMDARDGDGDTSSAVKLDDSYHFQSDDDDWSDDEQSSDCDDGETGLHYLDEPVDGDGNTLLGRAAMAGNEAACDLLIRRGI